MVLTEHTSCVCPYLIDLDDVMAILYNLGLYTRTANVLDFNALASWHACFPLYSLECKDTGELLETAGVMVH